MKGQILDIFNDLWNAGFLSLTGVFSGLFRWLGWMIVEVLVWLINGIESAITRLYEINTFFASEQVKNLINQYKPLVWTILGISIALIGFKLIFNKQSNRKELPMNILISLLVVTFLTTFMLKLSTVTEVATKSTGIKLSANQIVKSYITDLYTLDKNDYKEIKYGQNNLGDNLNNVEINEEIDTDNVNDDNEDIYENKYKGGETEELDDGFLGIGKEGYYRYVGDWIPLIIALISMAAAMACVAIKLTKLIIELAFNNLFATLLAFGDIEDGKKVKAIIKHILSIFVVIFSTAIMLKLYLLYNNWITDNFSGSDDTFIRLLLIIGGALAVIDGPNIVEKVLGVDAGLKSGWAAVAAGIGGAKVAAGAGKAAVRKIAPLAKAGASAAVVGAAGIGGAVAGNVAGRSAENKNLKSNVDTNGSSIRENSNDSSGSDNETNNSTIGNGIGAAEQVGQANNVSSNSSDRSNNSSQSNMVNAAEGISKKNIGMKPNNTGKNNLSSGANSNGSITSSKNSGGNGIESSSGSIGGSDVGVESSSGSIGGSDVGVESSSGSIGGSDIGIESSSGSIGGSDIGIESSSGSIGGSDIGIESSSGSIGGSDIGIESSSGSIGGSSIGVESSSGSIDRNNSPKLATNMTIGDGIKNTGKVMKNKVVNSKVVSKSISNARRKYAMGYNSAIKANENKVKKGDKK